jgi:predicted N-formylglutamate amidohydrolase
MLKDLERITGELKTAVADLVKPRLVITAPHAVCRDMTDVMAHYCDVVAGDVATWVAEAMKGWEVQPVLLIPKISRMEVDMNRPEARGTEFRNQVDMALGDCVFLLDVHSFPKLDMPWDVDCFLLKLSYGGNNDPIVYDLSKHLMAAGLNVAVVQAEKPNDVVLSAIERGVPAVLVEFNESRVQADTGLVDRFIEGLKKFLGKRLERGS